MKRTTLAGMVIMGLAPFVAQAQDQTDALRYSQNMLGGTARFMSMGGAFTALGGDASVLGYNPAGIGVFNKSQLSFSTGFDFASANATYNGTAMSGNQAKVTIENAAWIASWKNRNTEGMWKSIDFGIAYNRTNDFNSQTYIQGNNSSNSLLNQFVANSNGYTPSQLDPYSAQQAYYANGLIFVKNASDSTHYASVVDPFLGNNGNAMIQQKSIIRSGSMGETDFSFGANYNNKLYLGVTLGAASIRYNENANYTETPNYNDTIYGLQSFNYATTLTTTGVGLNLKLGFIFKPTDWLRIGGAIHTPTWFNLTDNYSSYISASYQNTRFYPTQAGTASGTADGNPASGTYNYTLLTPMRAMGGVAFVIAHKAIISADYEYVNYSTASLGTTDPTYSFSVANQAIKQAYMPASNLRFGAEYVLYPFSFRAGYAYYGNPYSSSAGNSTIRSSVSAGFGVKIRRCFVDLAYVLTNYSENYYLYDASYVNATQIKNSISDVVLSLGINF